MNKLRKWIIKKLGGTPNIEVSKFFLPTIEVSNCELIELQSRYIIDTDLLGKIPTEYIKNEILSNMMKKIDIPIFERKSKEYPITTEFIGRMKILKEYVKGDEND